MKKRKNPTTGINQLLSTMMLVGLMFLFLPGCQEIKEIFDKPSEKELLIKQYKEIGNLVIKKIDSDTSFRQTLYREAARQLTGDYMVSLDRVLEINESKKYWGEKEIEVINKAKESIIELADQTVTIFIPSIEKHPDKLIDWALHPHEPILVVAEEFDSLGKTANGYKLDERGRLSLYKKMDEYWAWEEDVIVVGPTEDLSGEHLEAEPNDTAAVDYDRVNGGAEKLGRGRVSYWDYIEPWISGKPEFRYMVYKSETSSNIIDTKLKKVKRKVLENNGYDYDHLIGNWNVSNWGPFVTVVVYEVDGKDRKPITISITVKGVQVSVSFYIDNQDDYLGKLQIPFTDPASTEYSLSGFHFKHKF